MAHSLYTGNTPMSSEAVAEPAVTGVRARAERTVRPVPAVTRAVAILRFLGASQEPLGVNAIARGLGLIPSTCLHILRVLVAEEMVAFDPVTKRYRLDAGLVTIARGALSRNGFADLAQPALDRLSRRHGVTAIGVQVMGLEHIYVVAISRPDQTVRLHVDIGSRFPALISASGQCVAAFGGHPWNAIERHFQGLRWDDPPSFEAWRAAVEATRERGYGLDEGSHLRGITVIAAPVRSGEQRPGHVVLAVGVSEQVRRIGVERLALDLREAADACARHLLAGGV